MARHFLVHVHLTMARGKDTVGPHPQRRCTPSGAGPGHQSKGIRRSQREPAYAGGMTDRSGIFKLFQDPERGNARVLSWNYTDCENVVGELSSNLKKSACGCDCPRELGLRVNSVQQKSFRPSQSGTSRDRACAHRFCRRGLLATDHPERCIQPLPRLTAPTL